MEEVHTKFTVVFRPLSDTAVIPDNKCDYGLCKTLNSVCSWYSLHRPCMSENIHTLCNEQKFDRTERLSRRGLHQTAANLALYNFYLNKIL